MSRHDFPPHPDRAYVRDLEDACADGVLTKDKVDTKIAPHTAHFGDAEYWRDLAVLATPAKGTAIRATDEARDALHALLMNTPGDD